MLFSVDREHGASVEQDGESHDGFTISTCCSSDRNVDKWDANRPEEPAVFFPGEDDIDNLQRIA